MADPVVTSHHGIAPPLQVDQTVTLTIDGNEVEAHPGEFLIAAAERAGVFIPRFCYHPRMKPVGMCRMCLVEVDGPKGPSLQPSCYIPVSQGMAVVTDSDKVKKAQDGVLELLLVNHPLDCPVCDKGGECPLQDQVLAYGPGESRFVEEKRHWLKPMPISELVLLDRERCIQCGRCVRFAAEVAGEAQIDFAGRGDRTEVAIFEEQPFSSYFSGNTVQICPVGALTASPYRFAARPWDLDQIESTCTTCAVGCRVAVQSSANRLTRMLGLDSDPVNQSWLCDKGRFGYEAVGSDNRLTEPLIRREAGGELEPATWSEALRLVVDRLSEVKSDKGAEAIGVIGGARLSNEDAYAWSRLAKGVIGTDSVDAQLDDGLAPAALLGFPRATIDQMASARTVILLTGDLREELPVLYLRLRGAAVDGHTKVIELAQVPTASSEFAATLTYRPGEAENVVKALLGGSSAPKGVDPAEWTEALATLSGSGDSGEGVVVVVGRPSMAEHGSLTLAAAGAIAKALPKATFLPALRRGNIMGALDMGLAPGLLPGRVTLDAGRAWFSEAWGQVPASPGRDTAGILAGLSDGSMVALVLLGADPLGDVPDRAIAERGLDGAKFVLAVDSFLSPSAAKADVVLPSAMHHERSGTTTNIEGRITRVGRKVVAPGLCRPDWMIAAELADRMGQDFNLADAGAVWDEVERLAPAHAGITNAVLDRPGSRDGVLAPLVSSRVSLGARPSRPVHFDPVATPGIESVEMQGAPPRAGAPVPEEDEDELDLVGVAAGSSGPGAPAAMAASTSSGAKQVSNQISRSAPQGAAWATKPQVTTKPQVIVGVGTIESVHTPPLDKYSLRLVATRTLYDGGVLLEVGGSLTDLVESPGARVHPSELERLGSKSGDRVRLCAAQGKVELSTVADATVPRGVIVLPFNIASEGQGVSSLIMAGEPVVEIRLESL